MNRVSASQLLPDDSGEKKAFEWALSRLDKHQKLYFFDVGANDGDYLAMLKSICLSKKLDFSVYVFEPSSSCFALLVDNNKNATNIKLYQLALSEEDGFAKLYTPYDKSTNASLAVLDFVSTYTKNLVIEPVSTIRLDSFCEQNNIERIDFLKLDIEGFELSAIRGSHLMILAKKIKFIQIEIEIGHAAITTKSMLFDFWKMLNNSYRFYLILNQGLIEIKDYKFDLECFYGASNFLLELK